MIKKCFIGMRLCNRKKEWSRFSSSYHYCNNSTIFYYATLMESWKWIFNWQYSDISWLKVWEVVVFIHLSTQLNIKGYVPCLFLKIPCSVHAFLFFCQNLKGAGARFKILFIYFCFSPLSAAVICLCFLFTL